MKQRFIKKEDKDELNGILDVITDNGKLILKDKNITLTAKMF